MKIVATSDLHYGSALHSREIENLIDGIVAEKPDVVMILGDHCYGDKGKLKELFEMYNRFRWWSEDSHNIEVLLCLGNHDYWVSKNQYNHHINSDTQRFDFMDLCFKYKFHCLDFSEKMIGDVAFVGGSMWYDYSFKPAGITDEQAALRRTDKSIWMDVELVKRAQNDKQFSDFQISNLREQFDNIRFDEKAMGRKFKYIVSGTHFLPFKECVKIMDNIEWNYFNSFMGSEKIGQLLVEYGVGYSLFGHSHSDTVKIDREFEVQGVKAFNVAYSKEKPFTTLILP